MYLNKRLKIIIISFTFLLILTFIFITVYFFSNTAKPIEQYQDQIQIYCSVYDKADSDYLRKTDYQSRNQTKFYQYDNFENQNLISTPYNIKDYIPYKITVTIKNNSEIEFSGKHLIGIFSPECVFTENSSISYWNGSLSPYTTKNYEAIIWFNKDLSANQIIQYISTLKCSYQLLGNFSYCKNTVVEKTIEITCVFKLGNTGDVNTENSSVCA